MPFKPGQARHPNAGRKKGSLNRVSVAFRDILDAREFDIVAEAIAIYRSTDQVDEKIRILEMLAGYAFPKPKAVEDLSEQQLIIILQQLIQSRNPHDAITVGVGGPGDNPLTGGGE